MRAPLQDVTDDVDRRRWQIAENELEALQVDPLRGIEEHDQVPELAQLGALDEDPVEQQHVVGADCSGFGVDGSVCGLVEHCGHHAAAGAATERHEQPVAQRIEVVRIEVETHW